MTFCRYTRGIKTLKELLTKAKAGKVVDETEIPPVVSLGTAATKSSQPAGLVGDESSGFLQPSGIPTLVADEVPFGIEAPHVPLPDYDPPAPKLPEPLVPTQVRVPEPKPILVEPPVDYDTRGLPDPPQQPALPNPEAELRVKEYKIIAVTLKRNQEVQEAMKYLKLAKALEAAIASGSLIDLSLFPPAGVAENSTSAEPTATVELAVAPKSFPVEPEVVTIVASGDENPSSGTEDIFGAPPPPKTVLEALEQRLNKYKSEVEKANSASNSSKARRMGRIVKQFEEAIASYKKGKPVPFDELPTRTSITCVFS